MVTAVVESPLRQRQRQRLRSPLADAGSTGGVGDDDLEVRHLRPAKRASGSSGGGMRGRSAPPEIEIPTNGSNGVLDGGAIGGGVGSGRGYTSLRDIMSSSSPKDTTISPNDNNEAPGGGIGGGGAVVVGIGKADVHMIRHPLVKHAAYVYLQLTPSARDAEARRRMLQRRRIGSGGTLCGIFLGCFGFLGAFFGCGGD